MTGARHRSPIRAKFGNALPARHHFAVAAGGGAAQYPGIHAAGQYFAGLRIVKLQYQRHLADRLQRKAELPALS